LKTLRQFFLNSHGSDPLQTRCNPASSPGIQLFTPPPFGPSRPSGRTNPPAARRGGDMRKRPSRPRKIPACRMQCHKRHRCTIFRQPCSFTKMPACAGYALTRPQAPRLTSCLGGDLFELGGAHDVAIVAGFPGTAKNWADLFSSKLNLSRFSFSERRSSGSIFQ